MSYRAVSLTFVRHICGISRTHHPAAREAGDAVTSHEPTSHLRSQLYAQPKSWDFPVQPHVSGDSVIWPEHTVTMSLVPSAYARFCGQWQGCGSSENPMFL